MFSVGRMQVRDFRRFRQNGPFQQGKETRFTKNTVCATPIKEFSRAFLNPRVCLRVDTKTTKTTKTTQTATSKELSAGLAEITETTERTKTTRIQGANHGFPKLKNLSMRHFLMGCFPVDFQETQRLLRTKSGKRPIKVGKRPIKERKRPIKAMVLVGISVGCLMGCFRTPPPWRKTAPLKRPIKTSMTNHGFRNTQFSAAIQRREKRTRPPPKENLLRNFSGQKEKFPGRWWIPKPYKNQENHIYHRNLSSVAPMFFGKTKFCTGAGRCTLSFSQ